MPKTNNKIGIIMNSYSLDESPTLYYLSKHFVEAGYEFHIFIDHYSSEKNTYRKIGVNIHFPVKFNGGKETIPKFNFVKSTLKGIFKQIKMLTRQPPIMKSAVPVLVSVLTKIFLRYFVYNLSSYFNQFYNQTRSYARFLTQQNLTDYLLLIIAEPEGLLAFHFSKLGFPFVYLSLELNNLSFEKTDFINIFKHITAEKYIKKAEFIIIQDEAREKILRKDYKLFDMQKVMYLPASLKGDINRNKTDYFQKRFSIPDNKKIVLYAGSIMPWACITEIIESMKKWDNKFVFVIHGGRFDNAYLENIRNISLESDRLFISTDWVEYDQLDKIISSSHIGISSYIDDTLNNCLTIKASGKIAAYLKSGLPILTRNFVGMSDFYRRTGCGESFDSFDQIGEQLSIIDNDYDRYQENAYRTFREDYSIDRYLNDILDYLIDQNIIPAS